MYHCKNTGKLVYSFLALLRRPQGPLIHAGQSLGRQPDHL